MDMTLMLWGLGGALLLGIMMLVVVMIARGMDKAGDSKSAANPATTRHGETATNAALVASVMKAVGVTTDGTSGEKNSKNVQALVSIGVAIAVIGGVVGFVGDLNDGDIAPEVSEIAAGELHGTMVNARNSDPVVLIVPGSGPTDRDGNNPVGLRTDAYRLLAEGLAEERISTVRVDKRGMFGSAAAGNPNAVTPADYVADIHAWIDAIKAARGPGSGCVFLLGHSEGALMVSLAAEGREDVCGLILVAGMGRKMGDVIRQQLHDNPANAPVLDEALAALSELEAGRHVDTTNMHPALLPLFAPQVQDYLISVINLDPVEAVRRANKKTLIVQGKTDMQVSVDDARLLNTAPKTKLQLIDGMNHVLKAAPVERAANYATYSDPSLPLAKRLVSRIEDFVDDND
jgi:pimeloyl-ACP methyl ester carboxylesterase